MASNAGSGSGSGSESVTFSGAGSASGSGTDLSFGSGSGSGSDTLGSPAASPAGSGGGLASSSASPPSTSSGSGSLVLTLSGSSSGPESASPAGAGLSPGAGEGADAGAAAAAGALEAAGSSSGAGPSSGAGAGGGGPRARGEWRCVRAPDVLRARPRADARSGVLALRPVRIAPEPDPDELRPGHWVPLLRAPPDRALSPALLRESAFRPACLAHARLRCAGARQVLLLEATPPRPLAPGERVALVATTRRPGLARNIWGLRFAVFTPRRVTAQWSDLVRVGDEPYQETLLVIQERGRHVAIVSWFVHRNTYSRPLIFLPSELGPEDVRMMGRR